MLDFLADRARISPDHPALIFKWQAWSYAALNEWAAEMCARLAAAGVRPGHRVAMLLSNRPETVALVHSLVRMGVVVVPLNLRLTPRELDALMGMAGPEWLVVEDPAALAGWMPACSVLAVSELATGETEASGNWLSRSVDLEDEWGILFTSGTSGVAKGAVLTLANLYASAFGSAVRLGTLPDDRWLLGMPLYHVGGLSILFRCCLYGTTVVLEDGFDPERFLETLEADRVTLVSLVPTMLRRLLDEVGTERVPAALRLVLLGGAAARPELVVEALDRGFPVALTYGLTEAASQVATALPDAVTRKPDSVGKPLSQTQLRIVNEHGEVQRHGEAGEILVKGPTVMSGYLGMDRLDEGWLHTGDIGFLDEAGDLHVLQRRTDLIVSGGENIYPAEIENALRIHPAISDACVVGLPDEVWGQRVAALVVPAGGPATAEDIKQVLRSQLAGYKIPHVIAFADELPCTSSGKVCRPDVVDMLKNLPGKGADNG